MHYKRSPKMRIMTNIPLTEHNGANSSETWSHQNQSSQETERAVWHLPREKCDEVKIKPTEYCIRHSHEL